LAGGDDMRYLDANVFLYPLLHEGPPVDAAIRHLRALLDGEAHGCTSALTLDEVAYVMQRAGYREAGIEECQRLLGMPNLRVLPATPDTVRTALDLMERVPMLRPRDAVHAATALDAGIFTIVSDDRDFDKVPGLRREGIA
jgi:uncharacterized protein